MVKWHTEQGVSDDTWETYIFILIHIKFLARDLVTEEDSGTTKCAVPCKTWETIWKSGNSMFMWTLNVLYSKLEQVNSNSMERFPVACLGPVCVLRCFQ